jgi:hypothetical protein
MFLLQFCFVYIEIHETTIFDLVVRNSNNMHEVRGSVIIDSIVKKNYADMNKKE